MISHIKRIFQDNVNLSLTYFSVKETWIVVTGHIGYPGYRKPWKQETLDTGNPGYMKSWIQETLDTTHPRYNDTAHLHTMIQHT